MMTPTLLSGGGGKTDPALAGRVTQAETDIVSLKQGKATTASVTAVRDLALARTRETWANGQTIRMSDYADLNAALAAIRQRTIWPGERVTLEVQSGATPMLSELIETDVDYGAVDLVGLGAAVTSGNLSYAVAGAAPNWSVTVTLPAGHGFVAKEFISIRRNAAGAYLGANAVQILGTWPVTAVTPTSATFTVSSSRTTLDAGSFQSRIRRLRSIITTSFGGPKLISSRAPRFRDVVFRSSVPDQNDLSNVGLTMVEGSIASARTSPLTPFPPFADAYRGLHVHGFATGVRMIGSGTAWNGSIVATGCVGDGIYVGARSDFTSYDVLANGNGRATTYGCGFVAVDGATAYLGCSDVPTTLGGNGNVGIVVGYGADVTCHWAEAYGNGVRSGNNLAASSFENGIQRQFGSGFVYDGTITPTPNTTSPFGAQVWRY